MDTETSRKRARHSSAQKCSPRALKFGDADMERLDQSEAHQRSATVTAPGKTEVAHNQQQQEGPSCETSSEEGEGHAGAGAAAAAAKALARVMRLQSELSRLQRAIQAGSPAFLQRDTTCPARC
jgi:hypothetical protein